VTYPPAGQRVTRNGITLTARMWAYLEASYTAAGIDPDAFLVVTQGSFRGDDAAEASGSTHDKGGAADLRTWNLPPSTQADLCEVLVVELRRRGGAAWFRDEDHGGMEPHVHVILGPVGSEADLSSGAQSQVHDYEAGRNGLSNKGSDYHPRPTQTPFAYPPLVELEGAYLVDAGRIVDVSGSQANELLEPLNASKGVAPMPYFQGSKPGFDAIVAAFGPIVDS